MRHFFACALDVTERSPCGLGVSDTGERTDETDRVTCEECKRFMPRNNATLSPKEYESMTQTRCKFECHSVTKRKYGNSEYVYEAEFGPVYGSNPENAAFFKATPSGSIKVGTIKESVFEPGAVYYIDFTKAE